MALQNSLAEELPPYKRLLTGEDAKKAAELEKQIGERNAADDYAAAAKAAEELLALRRRVQGAEHHEAVDVRWQIEAFRKLAALPAAERAAWGAAEKAAGEADLLEQQGRYAPALPSLRRMLEISSRVLGESHPRTATACNNLAYNLNAQGQFSEAEALFQQALESKRRVLGDLHPDTAFGCNNLAYNLNRQGKYAQAEPLYQKALDLFHQVLGETHPATSTCCNNLAGNLSIQGKYAQAEPLYLKTLTQRRQILGESHASVAVSYNNLATNLGDQGKYQQAEVFCRKALAISRQVQGADHPFTAICSSNLATKLEMQGEYAQAESLHQEALRVFREVLGEMHPVTAQCYNNLAYNLNLQRKHTQAEPLYQKALDLRREALGELHPDTAVSLNNLADNLNKQGKHAQAEAFFRKALDIKQQVLSASHPCMSAGHANLADNLHCQGQYAEAARQWALAAHAFEAARLGVTAEGLDRAVHAQERSPLPQLAACLARLGRSTDSWQRLEQHLGRGLLDDYSARLGVSLSESDRRRLDEINARRLKIDREVSDFLNRKGGLAEHKKDFVELTQRRKSVQDALDQLAAELKQRDVFDLKHIQRQLPPEAALVGWLDMSAQPKAKDPHGEHWVFLLTSKGEPAVVKMPGSGKEGAWTTEDGDLPGAVRAALMGGGRSGLQHEELLLKLARQRLAPLEPHLRDVRHLIVLPSQAMAGIPVEALTDRFLLSYAPSGTWFTKLQEQRRTGGRHKGPLTLLAIGDPVFMPAGELPNDAVAAALRGPKLTQLPGTRREVEAIAALFQRSEKLLGADASKQKVASLEPRLKEFDVIHLATHGLINRHVALNSAVVLCQRPDDDGQVSALHMKDKWNLNTELVVLSACETGLGQWSGGEGYLGFSQALFLAGARSIILSQWQVSDTATALLMVRFYENWLGARNDKSMTKAEALKEAKHWLRNLTRKEVEERLANLPEAARGLKLESDPSTPQAADDKPFAHPYYWAAFILIGDPE
jgi:CHAT domain-containing protein/tetratricopeptide (TPR) repeat protein